MSYKCMRCVIISGFIAVIAVVVLALLLPPSRPFILPGFTAFCVIQVFFVSISYKRNTRK